jgi:phosphopantothenoylcysteine synthetase/decarboxylase
LDAIALTKKKGYATVQAPNQPQAEEDLVGEVKENMEIERENLIEETGDNVKENEQEMEDQTEDLETNERVDLSGDEGDKRLESDSSLSMTTKIKNVVGGKSPSH